MALIVLLLLSTLSLALLSMSAVEPMISRNLADGEQARFTAEAGVEWAFDTLRSTLDWNTFLAGGDPSRGAVLSADSPIPGDTAGRGTFTVTVRNDSMPGDALLTGMAVDAGGPTRDTNGQLIVTSVGSVRAARRAVQAVVRRIALPPVPAALAFPGEEAPVTVTGGFEIDGNDRTPDGLGGACAPVFGISVSSTLPLSRPGANEEAVERALGDRASSSVRGKAQDPSTPGTGANAIAPDGALTPAHLRSFVRAAGQAGVNLALGEPGGFSVSDVGAACASSWSSAACWGTGARPKVVYAKGSADAGAAVSRLEISGNMEAHGILIVEDAEVRITGNFRWHGLIVLTGGRVALEFAGGGDQTVYGAVLFDATPAGTGSGARFLTGAAKVRYSCEGLDEARRARKLMTLRSWREVAQ
ncbi:MAG: hypothetical protein HY726_02320 [Candidatus Rokubacteria bacterium]|nr:hypothetical protein [Candidatus Rokubacteria bacterium]